MKGKKIKIKAYFVFAKTSRIKIYVMIIVMKKVNIRICHFLLLFLVNGQSLI